jgi:hypothetical protein
MGFEVLEGCVPAYQSNHPVCGGAPLFGIREASAIMSLLVEMGEDLLDHQQ